MSLASILRIYIKILGAGSGPKEAEPQDGIIEGSLLYPKSNKDSIVSSKCSNNNPQNVASSH